ncbi:MAG: penicillin-binding protein activator, partial [Gammaproteobacteria bacterium]
ISGAFSAAWLELGGDITVSSSFGELSTLDERVAQALLIADSELRANRLARILGEQPEFYPRRRKDLDFVFLIARPVEARVLKPMLAFYFAGDLPVYSTSHVYTGTAATSQDNDLNGIKFCDMPWRIADDPIKAQAEAGLSGASGTLSTLFALGVDAYRLHPRLGQLLVNPDSRYYGVTGALRIPEDHRVKRGLMWAQFVEGRPEVMPLVVGAQQTRAATPSQVR